MAIKYSQINPALLIMNDIFNTIYADNFIGGWLRVTAQAHPGISWYPNPWESQIGQ